MLMDNIWLGAGFTLGGSLGVGANTTTGVLLNASDLTSLLGTSGRPIRFAEISQITYSGMVGIDFSGNYECVIILAQVISNIQEIAQTNNYSAGWDLNISLDGLNTSIGHAIARLGKFDRSVAKIAGVTYAWAARLAKFVDSVKSNSDLLKVVIGSPPSMVVLPVYGTPWSFDISLGRKNQISTTIIQSSGSRSLN